MSVHDELAMGELRRAIEQRDLETMYLLLRGIVDQIEYVQSRLAGQGLYWEWPRELRELAEKATHMREFVKAEIAKVDPSAANWR